MSTISPTNDGELIRSLNARISKLEAGTTQRVGNFVLSDKDGALTATAPGADPVNLSAPAEAVPVDLSGLASKSDIAAAIAAIPPDAADPVGEIINAILGTAGSLLDLQAWAKLIPLLTGPLELGGKLLSEIIPDINASHLFGNIRAELLSLIPVGALTSTSPNRVRNGTFPAGSIAPADDWSVDTSEGASRTATDGTGSAHVVADGRPHALRTGKDRTETMLVGVNQKVAVSGYVRHQAVVVGSDAPPVLLQVVPYDTGGVEQTPVTVDTYTPATPDLPWPGRLMAGTWTVPDGIIGIQDRGYITPQALAGEYWMDDITTTQVADISVIPGLSEAFQVIDGTWHSTWDTLASAARGFPVIGADLAELGESFANFSPGNIVAALGSINLAGDMQGLVNVLFGIFHGKAPTGNASISDLQNAANQALSGTTGVDEVRYVKETTFVPVDPSWTNWIDAVPCGRGQAGQNGVPGFFGQGGAAAIPNPTTWAKGTHYDGTLTGVQVTINTDGSVVMTIPGHSITALPATGPLVLDLFGNWQGRSSGVLTYNDHPYTTGGVQNSIGQPGLSPGGGGAGARGILIPHGGAGGAPAAWVRCRANDVDNPSTGADTTGPGAPTSTTTVATNSSLTFTATGSVDA